MKFTDEEWLKKKKLMQRCYKRRIKRVLKSLRTSYPAARMRMSHRTLSVWIFEKINITSIRYPDVYVDYDFHNKIEVGLL